MRKFRETFEKVQTRREEAKEKELTKSICPVSGTFCEEKKNTCMPDWNGHGAPAYCHLK